MECSTRCQDASRNERTARKGTGGKSVSMILSAALYVCLLSAGCRLCANEVIQTQKLFYFLFVLQRVLCTSGVLSPSPTAGHFLGVFLNFSSLVYLLLLHPLRGSSCANARSINMDPRSAFVGHLLRIHAGRVCVCIRCVQR